MSWEQDRSGNGNDRGYHQGGHGGNYRNVNQDGNGGLTITKNFHNGGGNRYNDDNRGGYNNRGRGDGWRGRGGGQQWGGRGDRGGRGAPPDAPKKLPGNMMPRKVDAVEPSVQLAQKLLVTVGDFTAMPEDHDLYGFIKVLASTLASGGDLKEFAEELAGLFVKCFSQLSVQIPILASVLALVHVEEPQFSGLVLERLQQRLLTALAEDDVPSAKLLLRAAACLGASGSLEVEGEAGLLGLLQPLLGAVSGELCGGKSALHLTPAAQASAYLLASTMQWAAPSMYTLPSAAPFLAAAHSALQQVLSQWRSPYALGGVQAVFNTFTPLGEEGMDTEGGGGRVLSVGPSAPADASAWDALWESCAAACALLDELKASAASGAVYEYPTYMNAHWVALAAEGLLSAGTPTLTLGAQLAEEWAQHSQGLGSRAAHCTPAGALASVIGSSAGGSWLRTRISIFDADTSEACAACCALSAHAKYTARGYLEDIVTFFDPVVNEDGTKLGSIELLASHLVACFKLFPAEAHLEYLLVETLLQVLLQPPVHSALSACVFRLVLELCRSHPQTFPPVVALGTNTVFQVVPDLDTGAALEFGRWFSFHLINTQLSWPPHYWDFWVGEMSEAEEAGLTAVPLFVRAVVERLSYAVIPDKLNPALPQALHRLIPVNAPAHCALFTETPAQSMLGHLPRIVELAAQLKDQIEAKADPEDVADWLADQSVGPAGDEALCWRACLLLQVLVRVATAGNESALSAVVGLLDRYSEGLFAHASSDADHMDLLAMLREVYGGSQYMHQYVLEEMLRRGQISVTAATSALCAPDAAGRAAWAADPSSLACLESALDRAVDFVKAAVAQRSQLGGDFSLDETAELSGGAQDVPAAGAGGSGARKRAARAAEDQEGEGEGAMDGEGEEGDGEDRRKRSRLAEDAQDDAAVMEDAADPDQEEDPLWAADEALKSALRNSRAVFATATASFRQAIASQSTVDSGDVALVAASQLRRTWRLFLGTERHLAHQQQRRAVLSAPQAQLRTFLHGLGLQVDADHWLS